MRQTKPGTEGRENQAAGMYSVLGICCLRQCNEDRSTALFSLSNLTVIVCASGLLLE